MSRRLRNGSARTTTQVQPAEETTATQGASVSASEQVRGPQEMRLLFATSPPPCGLSALIAGCDNPRRPAILPLRPVPQASSPGSRSFATLPERCVSGPTISEVHAPQDFQVPESPASAMAGALVHAP